MLVSELGRFLVLLSLVLVSASGSTRDNETPSLLTDFLDSMVRAHFPRCQDSKRLMPSCEKCIPGLQGRKCDFPRDTLRLRAEIAAMVKQRYPNATADRALALYPYLETDEFLNRQREVGDRLGRDEVKHVVDIGAYVNPIHLFLGQHCPETVVVIEPILEPLSVFVPCINSAEPSLNASTHVLHLPLTFKRYLRVRHLVGVNPDAVVCIGCDGHHGPTKRDLLESWPRPYTLYLEFTDGHRPNKPFLSIGKSPGATALHESERSFGEPGAYSLRKMRFTRLDPA